MTTTEYHERRTSHAEREQAETKIAFLEKLIKKQDDWLQKAAPGVQELLEARHEYYDMPKSLFSKNLPIDEQLYDEPTYNTSFVYGTTPAREGDPFGGRGGDLDFRKGKAYHQGETIDQNGEYAQKILRVGQDLGFIQREPLVPSDDPMEKRLGMALGDLDPMDSTVQAIVIPTAAGLSNPARVWDAFHNLKSRAVKTDTVIIASCERPVPDKPEKNNLMNAGFTAGDTEYGSAIAALNDIVGTDIKIEESQPLSLPDHPQLEPGRFVRTEVAINGDLISVIVVSAPFENGRIVSYGTDGQEVRQNRAGTDDNYRAALAFLPEGPGKVVIESHDTWIKGQEIMADQILGVEQKEVIATGPRRINRVQYGQDGRLILTQPEGVIDEIAKTFRLAMETRVALVNAATQLKAVPAVDVPIE